MESNFSMDSLSSSSLFSLSKFNSCGLSDMSSAATAIRILSRANFAQKQILQVLQLYKYNLQLIVNLFLIDIGTGSTIEFSFKPKILILALALIWFGFAHFFFFSAIKSRYNTLSSIFYNLIHISLSFSLNFLCV